MYCTKLFVVVYENGNIMVKGKRGCVCIFCIFNGYWNMYNLSDDSPIWNMHELIESPLDELVFCVLLGLLYALNENGLKV